MVISDSVTVSVPSTIPAIHRAADALGRDLRAVTDSAVAIGYAGAPHAARGTVIALTIATDLEPEQYRISIDGDQVLIAGGDELGTVYGAYHVSHEILRVDPYHRLTGRQPVVREQFAINSYSYLSRPPAVRYRGVFFNDEDLLIAAHREIGIPLATWAELFETVLRLGYNMVIPGSGVDPADDQLDLAHEMGLFITHHHAEPLGAPMFSDRFRGDVPRWPSDRDRLETLYREAVEQQRHRRVVWSLGFRGQGDVAFYESDGATYTPAERGRIISEVIAFQRAIVDEMTEQPQEFVHNVYAESAELLRGGYLTLPDGVIPVFADNGYGAMRMRRRGLAPEERVSSVPPDGSAPVGVYYHVQFHDLQAASKLVSVISPELIANEMRTLFARGHLRYAVNNVGPLVGVLYPAELVARILSNGPPCDSELREFTMTFLRRYVPDDVETLAAVLDSFYRAPARFGEFRDQVAGDQIHHDPVCAAIRGVLRGESTVEWFQFLDPAPATMREAVEGLLGVIEPSLPRWRRVAHQADSLARDLGASEARFVTSFLVVPSRYMELCARGALKTARALLAYLDGNYKTAFIDAAAAHRRYRDAWSTLVSHASGRFQHIYRGEWETDTRETIRSVRTMMGMARIMGDWRRDWWRSEWVIEAIHPSRTAGSIVSQASMRYGALAQALLMQQDCPSVDHYEMLLEDEREADD